MLLGNPGVHSELLHVLNTPAGKTSLPLLANQLQPNAAKEVLFQSTVDLVNNAARGVKPDLLRSLGARLKSREVSTLFSIPLKTVQNIFSRKRSLAASPLDQGYPPNVSRQKHHPIEIGICTTFFKERCAFSSSFSRESPTLVLRVT
jgi:hypothetical protein